MDGPVEWEKRGRVTDMGHADFLEGGVDRREPKPSPFRSPKEVWAFDAVKGVWPAGLWRTGGVLPEVV